MKEQEVKIRIDNPKEIVRKLNASGYLLKDVIEQTTYRCWRPDRLFSRAGIYPRTREEVVSDKDGNPLGVNHTFTVKSRYKDVEQGLFEREEVELRVSDSKKMAEALSIMGMSDQRILQKERRYFKKEKQKVTHVLLDRFCFGTYLEIEGDPKHIESLLVELGLNKAERLGMAYWDVYYHYCKNNGIEEQRDLLLEDKVKGEK